MPAFEVISVLASYGIKAAVRMGFLGDLSITVIENGNHYTDMATCIREETQNDNDADEV